MEQYDKEGKADHYNNNRIEVIDMMVAIWGIDSAIDFCEMNAFKYRMRILNKKDQPIEQELKKIGWYEAKAKELLKKIE